MSETLAHNPVDVDALVHEHLPLVRYAVAELAGRLPAHVDRDDLVAAGQLGLVQAAQAYRPERGVPFARFAKVRIRGALLDELRSRDWASRSVRSRARRVAAATEELSGKLGRVPTAAELATHTGLSLDELRRHAGDIERAMTITLDALPVDGLGAGATAAAREEDNPSEQVVGLEERGYLADAVLHLPERLRRVVVGYFFEELQLRELATELGVTESRISQLRNEAVDLLRDGLTANLDSDGLDEVQTTRGRGQARRAAYRAAVADSSDYRARLRGTPVLERLALAGVAA